MKSHFCSNPKCQYHSHMVEGYVPYLYKQHSMKMGHAPVHECTPATVTLEKVLRYQVYVGLHGTSIQDFLCEVCYEVYKMVYGED